MKTNPLCYRGYYFDQDTGFYYLQSRYYDPAIGRFINADSLVSTGQGALGFNMFAYCLNNPVAHSDGDGMDARVCIAADGTMDDSPWRDISPSGGGIIYHCDNITTKYDGDKFYTQKALRHIGNFAKKWWGAYEHSIELQMQEQHQQNMAVREHWNYVFSSPERLNNFLEMVVVDVSAYSAYVTLATASTVALGPTVVVIGGLIGAALTTLSYYGYIDVSSLTWEDFLG